MQSTKAVRPWLRIASTGWWAASKAYHAWYDAQLRRVHARRAPAVVGVGNLSLGGTGKTPLVLHLAGWLSRTTSVVLLSRGYKRTTRGFRWVNGQESPFTSGDEAYLCFKRFQTNGKVAVAVCENRRQGIAEIVRCKPDTRVILLDDAFQHRRIRPTLSLLLTPFHAPFFRDDLFPLGRLREPRSGAARADLVVVTKTPLDATDGVEKNFFRAIQACHPKLEAASVFFAHMRYKHPICFWTRREGRLPHRLLLVTGIADPLPLRTHLLQQGHAVVHLAFSDHRWFDYNDVLQVVDAFERLPGSSKAIVTTEKDGVRLQYNHWQILLAQFPIFYLPVAVCFAPRDQLAFEAKIMDVCGT